MAIREEKKTRLRKSIKTTNNVHKELVKQLKARKREEIIEKQEEVKKEESVELRPETRILSDTLSRTMQVKSPTFDVDTDQASKMRSLRDVRTPND